MCLGVRRLERAECLTSSRRSAKQHRTYIVPVLYAASVTQCLHMGRSAEKLTGSWIGSLRGQHTSWLVEVWCLFACWSTLLGTMGASMDDSFIWCGGMSMAFSMCFSGFPVLSSLVIAFTSLRKGTSLHCYHMSLFVSRVSLEGVAVADKTHFCMCPLHEIYPHRWLCELHMLTVVAPQIIAGLNVTFAVCNRRSHSAPGPPCGTWRGCPYSSSLHCRAHSHRTSQ